MKQVIQRKKNAYATNRGSLVLFLGLLLFSMLFSGGCAHNAEPISKTAFFFNTVVTLTFYSDQDAALFPECEALCREYENLLSRTVKDSDIYRINHAGGDTCEVDPETASLIGKALEYCELTDGAVDITVAPLMDLWDFTSEAEKHVPAAEEIEEKLAHVDYRNISVTDHTVTISDPEAAIDLGFIAKGFIADKLKEFLLDKGVEHAIINLGGNVDLIGSKPDGSDYHIGIRKPFGAPSDYITTVSASDTSLVSSGIYERYFEENNRLYHHILDPSTGYPVENDLRQVTVLCKDSMKADALSTSLLLLGKEKGTEFIDSMEDASAAFTDTSDRLTYSEGFPR